MVGIDSTMEDLEKSLDIPSFEEELALSDLPHRVLTTDAKGSHYVKCKVCGANVLVGPFDIFKCPNAPHDSEDEPMTEFDIQDRADEQESED